MASAIADVYNCEIFLSILYFFPECQTHTWYSLTDTSYFHLKSSVFKTQLIISTFLSILSFFLPLMFYVLVNPPTTSHYSCRLERALGVISDPFLDPTSIYLVTSFCLFYLINRFWISLLFFIPLATALVQDLIVFLWDYCSTLLTICLCRPLQFIFCRVTQMSLLK